MGAPVPGDAEVGDRGSTITADIHWVCGAHTPRENPMDEEGDGPRGALDLGA